MTYSFDGPFLVSTLAVADVHVHAARARVVKAGLVTTYLSLLTHQPILVTALIVTRPHLYRLVIRVVVSRAVYTLWHRHTANLQTREDNSIHIHVQ